MNWQKFLDLVKKTGDRLIVTDKDEGEAYVIMSLSEYEALISGKSSVSSRDIDSFPVDEEQPPLPETEDFEANDIDDSTLSDEERFYLEPVE